MTQPKRWTKSMGDGPMSVITIRTTQNLSNRIDACTLIEKKTRSDLLREWIEEGIASIEQKVYEERTP